MRRVQTILEPCLFQAGPSVPVKRVATRDIQILTERDWSQESCLSRGTTGLSLFHMRCTFLVPSLENTQYFQRYSSFSVLPFQLHSLLRHHLPNLHNTKTLISLDRKQIWQKGERHSAVFFKSLQISSSYFSFHRHFKGNTANQNTGKPLYITLPSSTALIMLATVFSMAWCKIAMLYFLLIYQGISHFHLYFLGIHTLLLVYVHTEF